jgi:ParB-like chromosome segregation protein Spo0J
MPLDSRGTTGRNRGTGGTGETSRLARHLAETGPAVLVPVSALHPADSPRLDGECPEHVRTIAESETATPPLVVHRATMRVVDGMHRLRAAVARGQEHVAVHFFDGDAEEAFLLAVELNSAHGKPLTPADRRSAVVRIIAVDPARSDRWVAQLSGLSAKTVGAIRRCSTADDPRSNGRIGRDGRTRPLDSTEGRRIAGELMREQPARSLRDVARQAGIAPSTALDVRNRISAGLDAVPDGRGGARAGARRPASRRSAARVQEVDPVTILHNLRKDPALRFTEAGRALLRWLDAHTVTPDAVGSLTEVVPAHCIGTVIALARHNARSWVAFGECLDTAAKDGDESPRTAGNGA